MSENIFKKNKNSINFCIIEVFYFEKIHEKRD